MYKQQESEDKHEETVDYLSFSEQLQKSAEKDLATGIIVKKITNVAKATGKTLLSPTMELTQTRHSCFADRPDGIQLSKQTDHSMDAHYLKLSTMLDSCWQRRFTTIEWGRSMTI